MKDTCHTWCTEDCLVAPTTCIVSSGRYMLAVYAYLLYTIPDLKKSGFSLNAYANLGCNAIMIMIAEEQDRPIIVSKVKYLGSSLLPSPIEVEATIELYHNRMDISELDAIIPLDKVSKIELAKGKDLPSEAIMMFGVVGLIVEKESPYLMIKIIDSADSLLFKFENMIVAETFVKEIKAVQHIQ